MQTKVPYPYCPHGKYVGGCGIDWMCFPCEMGDEQSSPRELRQYVLNWKVRVAEFEAQIGSFELNAALRQVLIDHSKDHKGLRHAEAELEYALEWADNEDDDDWLSKQHQANIDEWDKANADEQFWSVPDYVLDGS